MKQGRVDGRHWMMWGARSLAALAMAVLPMGRLAAADADRAAEARPAQIAPGKAPRDAAANMRMWFAQLSDDSADVRDGARQKLLGISRKDLSILRDIVKQRVPLMPCESEVLRSVVTHVYLAGAGTPVDDPSTGFVGVWFDIDQNNPDPAMGGVEIRHRIPGSCASRYLEDGDVVLNIGNATPMYRVLTDAEVISLVKTYNAGEMLRFEVLRRGRVLKIPLVLGARPQVLPSGEFIPPFVSQQLADASGYWEETFQPLLDGDVATASTK